MNGGATKSMSATHRGSRSSRPAMRPPKSHFSEAVPRRVGQRVEVEHRRPVWATRTTSVNRHVPGYTARRRLAHGEDDSRVPLPDGRRRPRRAIAARAGHLPREGRRRDRDLRGPRHAGPGVGIARGARRPGGGVRGLREDAEGRPRARDARPRRPPRPGRDRGHPQARHRGGPDREVRGEGEGHGDGERRAAHLRGHRRRGGPRLQHPSRARAGEALPPEGRRETATSSPSAA